MRVHVGRAINGIGINGLEYLLDEDREPMVFIDEQAAKDFLFTNGYNESMVNSLIYEPIEDELCDG